MIKVMIESIYTIVLYIASNIVISMIMAFPMRWSWNCLAPKYFKFLPEVYLHFSYSEIVAVCLISIYIGNMINRIVPRFNSKNSKNSKTGLTE